MESDALIEATALERLPPWWRRKRVVLTALVIVLLGSAFWSGSRYPSLDEKALMGGDTHLESPLSFDSVLAVQASDGPARRVVVTTLNWAAENRQGMTFGLCLGAAFLTLFGLLPKRGSRNGLTNTLLGLGAGALLGVCVNCAAPIAKGMHDAGARLETTLAAMFSSPTLNVVVLTMVFTIFPLYIALIKVGLTVLFILVVVPLLCRTVLAEERVSTYDDAVCAMPPPPVPAAESWPQAIAGTARAYAINLWYIVRTTVPLMLLAGLLGAVVAVLLPLEDLAGLEVGLAYAVPIALLGLFLPVPIALDVVAAAVLLGAGLPVFYVTIMLFTLGVYSIYPFMIVWRGISPRCAMVLALALVVLSLPGAYVAQHYYESDIESLYEYLDEKD